MECVSSQGAAQNQTDAMPMNSKALTRKVTGEPLSPRFGTENWEKEMRAAEVRELIMKRADARRVNKEETLLQIEVYLRP